MPFPVPFIQKIFLHSILFLGQTSDLSLAVSDVIPGVSSAVNKKASL